MRYESILRCRVVAVIAVATGLLWLAWSSATPAQSQTQAAPGEFPPSLTHWAASPKNPIFTAEGPGHWDSRIRERGWILREGKQYRMWYTGYRGSHDDIKLLGYATSPDGLNWTRSRKNPLERDHWVEDMSIVHEGDTYYMFAEGEHDNHAVLLTSSDGLDWKWEGELDVRTADGKTTAKRPCGTPTVFVENGTWYLFYEWQDKGVWLAKTTNPKSRVWTNVQDEAVLCTGPAEYDRDMIATNQVIKHGDAYYMIYHGSGSGEAMPRTWNTDIARSTDLVHWQKYSRNPIVPGDRSSGILVSTPKGYRLYTMHDQVDVFESAE
jgi:beta-1,2-mannobiose phosphorylase / 1,2-beta-oligomannan phosphorylase